ncbi:plasma membrane protein Pth11-like protein [Xylariaceae sp. FL0662B]|nr:plasma membrane protein Pth11-like protein [Xylariaceae sp. FL0662B]
MASYEQQYYQTPGHVVAAAAVLSGVDIAATALRFWMRKRHRQLLKADDWLMVPATILTIGIAIILIYGVSHRALGYRVELPPGYSGNPRDLVSEQATTAGQLQWAFTLLFPAALGCIKTSILCLYVRVFYSLRRVRVCLIALVATVVLWTVGVFFAEVFQCGTKFWANWSAANSLVTQCVRTTYLALAFAATDSLADVVIFCIPIPLSYGRFFCLTGPLQIWRLNLSARKKAVVFVAFLLGGVAVAASLVRLVIIAQLVVGRLDPRADRLLQITTSLYWGMVECGAGVVAACLPTLQKLVRGGPWDSVVKTARTLMSSSASLTRLLRSKPSEETALRIQLDYATVDSTHSAQGKTPGDNSISASSYWVV